MRRYHWPFLPYNQHDAERKYFTDTIGVDTFHFMWYWTGYMNQAIDEGPSPDFRATACQAREELHRLRIAHSHQEA